MSVAALIEASPKVASVALRPAKAAVRLASRHILHPAVWLGHQFGRHSDVGISTGFATLDAELPGGGWPRRCLTELILGHPGIGEMRLLALALAAVQPDRAVMLFNPPLQIDAAALASTGIDLRHLIVVTARKGSRLGADTLRFIEQTLKSGCCGALLAWLPPHLQVDRLRRLQLAAHNHDGVAFVIREAEVKDQPSPAPLRLELSAAGGDRLRVRLLRRRGPPLLAPIVLALPSVLSAAATRRTRVRNAPAPVGAPAVEPTATH